ncbi:hypothetical protein CFC21_059846 [Triticum aestivum]|uniref:F-box protein AT5G49610-like beta-propeller domain-containing protein n=2 Tax=Triticum aestivum TaxID=4565 RepID=A0A3B6IWW4_WHEAT|nr:uncharacterized protein LOC123090415 [Triticum aestivum]KAF7051624.1 hypothetical protein CFC21_059846 [Triticum aestivum]
MGSEPPPPAAPAARPPSTPATAATTRAKRHNTISAAADGTTTTPATATTTATATTISSLGQDLFLEIFLRLPNLPDVVRAALTCRSWLGAVRSSPSFRRLFRALHPAPPIGLFLDIHGAATPSFASLRRSDPDVAAALRGGDFFLTFLLVNDDAYTSWGIMDCRDGYVLLWNKLLKPPIVAAVNPMSWAVDIIPVPRDVWAGRSGRRRNFAFLGFHLLSTAEKPSSFRVVRVCADKQRVRVAFFSPETRDWVIHPWVYIGGDNNLKSSTGTLVGGSVYRPFHGEGCMIRINETTMDFSIVDLPLQIKVGGSNFRAGETKDDRLCIVYASDDFLLHVWIRSVNADGIEIWVLQNIISLSVKIDRIIGERALGLQARLTVVQVRSGYVYLSMTCMTPVGTLHCWFFSLSPETTDLELLVVGCFDDRPCPYIMAWPSCLVGDDGSIEHEVEGSH